jgi:hypothetical protein
MTLAYSHITGYPLEGDAVPDGVGTKGAPRPSGRSYAMAHDVFITYSHVDKLTADATCAALERAGIRCWIAPRDITPGDEWSTAITKAISQCRVIVLIFSSNANASRQIRREVELAINAGVPLVPVRIEDVAPTESLAYFMSTVHWLDALTPPIENHLQKLAESIKALLQFTPAEPSPARAASPGPGDRQPMPAGPDAGPFAGAAAVAVPGTPADAEQKPAKRGMFAELMNFSYQRTGLQAFGWYLIYVLIGIVIGFVSGRFVDFVISDPQEAFKIGLTVGQFSAIPYHILVGTLLIWHRKKDGANVLLLLGGIVLSIILGALGGMIPFAFLTRRPALLPMPYSPYMRR